MSECGTLNAGIVSPVPETTVAIVRASNIGGDVDTALAAFSEEQAKRFNAAVRCMTEDGWGRVNAALTALLPTADKAMKAEGFNSSNQNDRAAFLVAAAVGGIELYAEKSGACGGAKQVSESTTAKGSAVSSW